jgi:hypothetical protein
MNLTDVRQFVLKIEPPEGTKVRYNYKGPLKSEPTRRGISDAANNLVLVLAGKDLHPEFGTASILAVVWIGNKESKLISTTVNKVKAYAEELELEKKQFDTASLALAWHGGLIWKIHNN